MLDSGTLGADITLPGLCGPRRGTRRPSGTAESESDSPPSKKSKKARRRRKRPRQRCGVNGIRTKPVAPFNTTQFLMAEHDLLQDTDIVARPRRHRDSSLSLDSEDQSNEFYSSPEDEEEFLTREFWTAYEDVHAERLDTMTKAQLVQEYLALEEKVDLLERQLCAVRARHRYRLQQNGDDDDDAVGPGELRVDSETAQKITIFQTEISNLETENRRLREENIELRRTSLTRSSSSSSSSSSSDSSSSSSDCSSDSEMENEEIPRQQEEHQVATPGCATTGVCSEPQESCVEDSVQSGDSVRQCQPDSGVSCDSPEDADPPTSSSTCVKEAGEVVVTAGKSEATVVEGEVTSTTAA
ncbi:HEXIM1-like [Homarus americanus]|uniref:HEXIM1-like n=2 Tax=Homarus americanus TaxID=6706 RepID=A0A8J5N3A9_HOMAM|nr:HEXIM1-like [Homarus americanus]